jgi:SAM-dependent methyltransferase
VPTAVKPAQAPTTADGLRSIEELRGLIRDRSTYPSEQTETIIGARFRALPKRLVYAMGQWPFDGARVLDLGCSYGHCLVHFAPGSVGLDNVPEHVEFCRSLGLDARLWNVEQGLDVVADGSFDIAWVSDIVEHLDAPRLLLRGLGSKLAPDGRLIVLVSALPRSRLSRQVFAGKGWFDAPSVHHFQFTVDTARYLVEQAGYVVDEVRVHMLPRGLRLLNGPLLSFAPVVLLSARLDDAALARMVATERRNKPEAGLT